MNLKMNIAVVDDGGHLLAFERMEGARPASGYTSLTKAITAATFRQATGPIPAGTANPDPILNLSLQNAALASGGKITTLYGGIPVTVDGQIIGGVGVGGGSGRAGCAGRAGRESQEFLRTAQGGHDGGPGLEGTRNLSAAHGLTSTPDQRPCESRAYRQRCWGFPWSSR